jgi:hypothetical protein
MFLLQGCGYKGDPKYVSNAKVLAVSNQTNQ